MPDKPTPAPVTTEASGGATNIVIPEPAVKTGYGVITPVLSPELSPKGPVCPHCGQMLRAEHDSDNHLHCDGPGCSSCCFDPGDPPTLRPNFPLCPSA